MWWVLTNNGLDGIADGQIKLPILLLFNEINLSPVGPFSDVDGTAVKLFRPMYSSCVCAKAKIVVNDKWCVAAVICDYKVKEKIQ